MEDCLYYQCKFALHRYATFWLNWRVNKYIWGVLIFKKLPEFYLICYKNLIWSNFHSSENLLDLPWDDFFMVFGIDNSFIIFGWIFTYWPCSVNFVVAWWHSWAIGIKTSVESRRVIKHRGMKLSFLFKNPPENTK